MQIPHKFLCPVPSEDGPDIALGEIWVDVTEFQGTSGEKRVERGWPGNDSWKEKGKKGGRGH